VLWLIIMFSSSGNPALGVAALVLFLFEIYISLVLGSTYYVLENGGIKIRRGPGRTLRIAYGNIVSATQKQAVQVLSALSSDAIEIRYTRNGGERSVLVSPEKKKEFFDKLEEMTGAGENLLD
ncbi:MAG: PH domain-containing protein, partial [Defluviitaleaceae bacterium]|nr:PH domain-containing protein [Defluviitaleaceae bacterium]